MQVRLTLVAWDRKPSLRTPIVEGQTNGDQLPKVGERFCMTAPKLTSFASIRYIETTVVEEVVQEDERTYEFRTQNSTYKLELL